jgi:hypothetical protein
VLAIQYRHKWLKVLCSAAEEQASGLALAVFALPLAAIRTVTTATASAGVLELLYMTAHKDAQTATVAITLNTTSKAIL